MNLLQFTASVIASISWPLAAVVIVWLLRRAIIDLLPRLKRLKVSGIDAEFSEKLAKAEADVAELPEVRVHGEIKPKKEEVEWADFSNNSAIFVAWLHVESAILNLARSKSLLEPNMNEFEAARRLRQNDIIDNSIYRAIMELRALRNLAVHPEEGVRISDEQLERFRVLAERVTSTLDYITQR